MQLNVRHNAAEERFVRSFHYDILAEPLFTATEVMYLSVYLPTQGQPWGQNDDVHQYFGLYEVIWKKKVILPMVMEMGLKGIAIEYIFWGN